MKTTTIKSIYFDIGAGRVSGAIKTTLKRNHLNVFQKVRHEVAYATRLSSNVRRGNELLYALYSTQSLSVLNVIDKFL